MKLKSRIAGSATALALALGMSAAPAFAAGPAASPPIAATGETVYPQGTQVSRGVCTGLLIGSLSNPTKTAGLTNENQAIASSSKGVYQNATQAAALQVGACLVDGRIGVTGLAGGVQGAKYVTKSGTKLSSSATSCNSDSNGNGIPRESATYPTGDFQPATRALTGKFSYTFSDLTKSDAYVRVQGFDRDGATIIWLTGIVAKGEFVGSTIGGNVWFNPVNKDKTATTYFDQAIPITNSPLNNTISYAIGYAGGGVLAGGAADAALGCLNGGEMGAGIQYVAIGGGSTDPLLGMESSGVHFLL